MPLNTLGKNKALDGLDESVSGSITHIGIGNLADPGTGPNYAGTEATGGSPVYARQVAAWSAAASELKSNSGTHTWDVPPGTYAFYLFFNALTGNTNNFLGYAPFGGSPRVFATCDAADVTANAITSSAHGFANTDRVMLFNVFAESLPAGLTEGTIYFVVGATTDTFQVSLTSGGAAVDITAIGELFAQKVVPETFGGQGQISATAGQIVLDASGI